MFEGFEAFVFDELQECFALDFVYFGGDLGQDVVVEQVLLQVQFLHSDLSRVYLDVVFIFDCERQTERLEAAEAKQFNRFGLDLLPRYLEC